MTNFTLKAKLANCALLLCCAQPMTAHGTEMQEDSLLQNFSPIRMDLVDYTHSKKDLGSMKRMPSPFPKLAFISGHTLRLSPELGSGTVWDIILLKDEESGNAEWDTSILISREGATIDIPAEKTGCYLLLVKTGQTAYLGHIVL